MEDHLNPPKPPKAKRANGRPPKYPPHWTPAQKRAAWAASRKQQKELNDYQLRVADYQEHQAQALDYLVPSRRGESNDFLDLSSVDVCTYVVKILFSNEMDYRRTVQLLRPNATPEDAFAFVLQLQQSAEVKAALDKLFRSIGIDDESRTAFVKQVWAWFYGDDKEKAMQASRILAKIFFTDSAEKDTVESLKIEGMEKGLERMLGTTKVESEEVIETNAYVMLEPRNE